MSNWLSEKKTTPTTERQKYLEQTYGDRVGYVYYRNCGWGADYDEETRRYYGRGADELNKIGKQKAQELHEKDVKSCKVWYFTKLTGSVWGKAVKVHGSFAEAIKKMTEKFGTDSWECEFSEREWLRDSQDEEWLRHFKLEKVVGEI